MGLFNRNNTSIVIPGLLVCLLGLILLQWSPTPVEGQTHSDPNIPLPNDPNTISDDDNDIFEVKLSSLVLINEAYEKIFTPKLNGMRSIRL